MMGEQQTQVKPGEVQVIDVNNQAIQAAKKNNETPAKVKKGKKGSLVLTVYTVVQTVALITQGVLDKLGILGRLFGASLGQVATNHFNMLCSKITEYIINNNLFSSPTFLKIFGGNSKFYIEHLEKLKEFLATQQPTVTQAMNGGNAVRGVIEQSVLMQVIGTVIHFVMENPILSAVAVGTIVVEITRRIIKRHKAKKEEKALKEQQRLMSQTEQLKGSGRVM